MFLLWLSSVALASQVYINGVQVHPPQVAGTTLKNVEVTFDEAGQVRIKAPGYAIEVVEPPAAAPAPAPVDPAPTLAPAGSFSPPDLSTAPITSKAGASATERPDAIPRARWWLVTEDNGSRGHVVDVYINGERVQTIKSGEPTRILDIGRHLHPGTNHVRMQSDSTEPAGGALYVYLGSGSDQGGTVVMDAPQVQYALGTARSGPYERAYTLQTD